jgi:putative spermidine/putrescine transport system permease protein
MNRRSHRLAIFLLLAPAVGYVAIFMLAVLAMTGLLSLGFFGFTQDNEIGIRAWIESIDLQTLDSLAYSVRIAIVSAFGALLLGYPLAIYLRGTFVGKTLLNSLLRVPLFMPALVAAFLILNIISFHGVVNEALLLLGVIREPLRLTHDAWGLSVVLIQIWKNLPFEALILTAVMANIPADLEAAARNLGAGRWAVFRHVLLPLSLPGAQVAVTLVFIGVLGDFAINSIAGPLYPPSLSIRMFLLSRNFGEWAQAAVVAILIMATAVVFAALFALLARVSMRLAR